MQRNCGPHQGSRGGPRGPGRDTPDLQARLRAAADGTSALLDALLPRPGEGPESALHEAMRYAALSGGKRLRPFLTLETGALFGADESALLRAACAIECVHAYSLVHDDLPCMDDDDLRRGRPTTHRQFGEATALLAGDALLTFAFEILAGGATHPDPDVRCRLVSGLASAAGPLGMVAGQMIDMTETARDGAPGGLALIARMNRLKTGALIGFAVEAGALIARASDAERRELEGYAQAVGAAFQVVDDILDVESSSAELGKTAGKDAAQGKINYVTVLGLDGAKSRARQLGAQAKAHLAMFGARAWVLSDAVDFVLERRS